MPIPKLVERGEAPAAAAVVGANAHRDQQTRRQRSATDIAAGRRGAPAAPRWVALDRLRAVSLLLMLFHHLTRWFSGGSRDVIPSLGGMTVTDIAAPAFAITAGASVVLFTRARRRTGTRGEVVAVVRRYGLLIPIGATLVWVVSGDPLEFGVLQMLGLTTLAAYAAGRLFGVGGTAIGAALGLALGPVTERFADASFADGSLAHNVFGDIFPVVLYAGFVCLGAAIAHAFNGPPSACHAVWATVIAGVPVVVLLLVGVRPQRYPSDTMFVLVSLVAAAGLYAMLDRWQPRAAGWFDRLLRAAARHTFGVYIGHYGIFLFVDRLAVPDVPVLVAMAMAAAGSAGIALLAPRVPVMPFSLRGVQRRPLAPR